MRHILIFVLIFAMLVIVGCGYSDDLSDPVGNITGPSMELEEDVVVEDVEMEVEATVKNIDRFATDD